MFENESVYLPLLTIFENDIPDRETLIEEIIAKKFYPAEGLNIGKVQKFQNTNF